MNSVIELNNVTKSFNGFQLKDVSLSVNKGFVTGLIGGNGVGKSTIIKMIMNLLQPDRGSISVFGLNYIKYEKEIKQRIGFVCDENIYYENITLRELQRIIKPMYRNWDDTLFTQYAERFELPLRKKIKTFSKGMLMKVSLTMALSHHADLIVMDEPTSGLDPIFRRELLEILQELMLNHEKTIFFSTHITTDLDKIADYITFIHNGQHMFTKEHHQIFEEYALVKGTVDLLDRDTKKEFLAIQTSNHGFEALTNKKERVHDIFGAEVLIEKPTLEDIMFYTKKGEREHDTAYS